MVLGQYKLCCMLSITSRVQTVESEQNDRLLCHKGGISVENKIMCYARMF